MLLTQASIADNVFVGTLPLTTDSEWMSMCLIDVDKIRDKGPYVTASVNIFLYARPKGTPSVKNVALLNIMEQNLDNALRNCQDPHYIISETWRDTDYDSARNFHYNVINVSVTAK